MLDPKRANNVYLGADDRMYSQIFIEWDRLLTPGGLIVQRVIIVVDAVVVDSSNSKKKIIIINIVY